MVYVKNKDNNTDQNGTSKKNEPLYENLPCEEKKKSPQKVIDNIPPPFNYNYKSKEVTAEPSAPPLDFFSKADHIHPNLLINTNPSDLRQEISFLL